MTSLRHTCAALLAAATFACAGAVSAQQAPVEVAGAWSRASLAPSRPGVLYLDITNTGDAPVALTGLETDVAAMPQIHRSITTDDGAAKMERAGRIEIAPGATVSLEPGGLHGMLMKLRDPLKEGDSYVVTLTFGGGARVDVTVPVLGVRATGPDPAQ